jgi:hypothetical protein
MALHGIKNNFVFIRMVFFLFFFFAREVRVAHYDKILWGSELEIKFQGENS